MARRQLTPELFLTVIDMVAGHLRLKEADRWGPQIARLKFRSFVGEFPEVSEQQFVWAAERWIQSLPTGFTRFPTWRELMAPLYRCENGLANRSWGFREELPPILAPSEEQLQLLPQQRRSIAAAPDPHNSEAYVPFHVEWARTLPPAASEESPLTPERWADYLQWAQQEEAEMADA